jgi:hypothetical protein
VDGFAARTSRVPLFGSLMGYFSSALETYTMYYTYTS